MGNKDAAFDEKIDFKYVLGEKEGVQLILFYGRINARVVPVLEECEKELKDKPHKILILNFHDVANLAPAAHIFFTKFQKTVRDAGKLLGVCGLRPDVKTSLLLAGIIRESELYNNIPDAWKALNLKLQAQIKESSERRNAKKLA